MKVKTHLAGITGACAALTTALALPASAADTGLYFNADAGVNWAQDADIKGGGTSETLKTDIGFRFSAGVGYNLDKNWGVEFDTGYVWNTIDKIGSSSFSGDSSFSHIPFIVNVVYRYQFGPQFETYIGGGAGGAYSVLSIDDTVGVVRVNDDDGDVVFAWQAIAGVRYLLSETMSVGVGYKYLGTTEGKYDIQGASVKVDSVHNHTFGAVFNWKF